MKTKKKKKIDQQKWISRIQVLFLFERHEISKYTKQSKVIKVMLSHRGTSESFCNMDFFNTVLKWQVLGTELKV
jgi:hypothetical protein